MGPLNMPKHQYQVHDLSGGFCDITELFYVPHMFLLRKTTAPS
jgi:hypothetical protein